MSEQSLFTSSSDEENFSKTYDGNESSLTTYCVELAELGRKLLRQVAADSLERIPQILATVHRVFRRVVVFGKGVQRFLDIALRRFHIQHLLDFLVEDAHGCCGMVIWKKQGVMCLS